jgi:hypothetical protein
LKLSFRCSRTPSIWITLTAFALLVPIGAIPSVSSTAAKAASLCPNTRFVAGMGEACRRPDGLYQLFAPDGSSAGLTHGPHAVQAGSGPGVAGGPGPVTCVTPDSQSYYVQPIYARASDDTDDSAARVPDIQRLLASASNYMREASLVPGSFLTLRVACRLGLVDVRRATLPTRKASASFSTITKDLKNLGYVSPRAKYIVFYDDPGICQCGGVANVYSDDSPGVANKNNGNADAMFGVDFGRIDAGVILHELSHTLGAVQRTAPHTTGAFHCTDGRDVMCFNDGGSKGSQYTTSVCAAYTYDCGKNDYFKRPPVQPGNYLATHWNIAGTNNRYVQLMSDSTPPASELLQPVAATTYSGCATKQQHPGSPDTVFVGTGCVQVSAVDRETGVVRIDLLVDDEIRDSAFNVETWTFQPSRLALGISQGPHIIGVVATNAAGLQSQVIRRNVTWVG